MFCTITSQVGGLRVNIRGLGYQFGESLDNTVLYMQIALQVTQSWSSLFAWQLEEKCGLESVVYSRQILLACRTKYRTTLCV